MCQEPNDTPNDTGVKAHGNARASVASVLQYTPPQYRKTKDNCYIEFYSFDPELGQLRRKRIRINRIKGAGNRERYAREVMKRICEQLAHGWNPWIAKDEGDLYTMEEGLTRYEAHIEKMLENGYYRKETYAGYISPAVYLEQEESITDLDRLQEFALEVLKEQQDKDAGLLLYNSGNSGGARPKAVFSDAEGHWIVKFRHTYAPKDIGVQEARYNEAARKRHTVNRIILT